MIIDRAVRAPGNGKYLVDGMNDRDKWMLKLEMVKLLNPKLIQGDRIFFYDYAS